MQFAVFSGNITMGRSISKLFWNGDIWYFEHVQFAAINLQCYHFGHLAFFGLFSLFWMRPPSQTSKKTAGMKLILSVWSNPSYKYSAWTWQKEQKISMWSMWSYFQNELASEKSYHQSSWEKESSFLYSLCKTF